MTMTLASRRLSDHDFRVVVSQALLHLDDPAWLADSPLVHLAEVAKRATGSDKLFADGHALAATLSSVVAVVVSRLEGGGRLGRIRAALAGVAEGKSIAAVARAQKLSREHFARAYWPQAVGLVADELGPVAARKRVRYTASRSR